MIKTTLNGLTNLKFEKLAGHSGFRHGVFTRLGGISEEPFQSLNAALHVQDDPLAVIENRHRITQAIGFQLGSLTAMQQVHSAAVSLVGPNEVGCGADSWEDALPETDAMITNQPGALLMALVADCTAVILYDPVRRAVGIAHGGWRGTLDRIGQRTVERMVKEFGTDPRNLIAGISPSIQPCCYPVGIEIAGRFLHEFNGASQLVKDGNRLDITKAMVIQLCEAGVRPDAIDTSDLCTSCRTDLFFSYRKEGTTGRFAVVAGIL